MGIGADAFIKVVGWNSTLVTAEEYVFVAPASMHDFAGFALKGDADAAYYRNEIEIGSSISVGEDSRVVICARNTFSEDDWSEVSFRPEGAALSVVQDHNAPEVYPSALHQRALTLNITAKGDSTYVDAFTFDFLGNVTSFAISAVEGPRVLGTSFSNTIALDAPLVLEDGDRRSIDVLVDLFGAVRTSSFGLSLNLTSGVSAEENTSWRVDSLQSGAKVGYVAEAPGRIAVDGAFADWAPRAPLRDLLGDAYSPTAKDNTSGDVDIDTVKLASTLDTASFYMSVNGTMMGGASVPAHLVRFVYPGPPAANITPTVPEPMYGVDFAFVLVDTDGNASTGFYIGGAERALSVAGRVARRGRRRRRDRRLPARDERAVLCPRSRCGNDIQGDLHGRRLERQAGRGCGAPAGQDHCRHESLSGDSYQRDLQHRPASRSRRLDRNLQHWHGTRGPHGLGDIRGRSARLHVPIDHPVPRGAVRCL